MNFDELEPGGLGDPQTRAEPVAPEDACQRRQDMPGPGGLQFEPGDVRQGLYRLPELLEASEGAIVLICKSEKEADKLASRGLVATATPLGVGKWKDHFADPLRHSRVVVLPGNEQSDQRHAQAIAASCRKRGIPAAVLRLEGDVSDWPDADSTRDRLLALAEAALEEPQAGEAPDAPHLTFAPASELEGRPVPPREWHVEGLIPARTVTLLGGDGGTGKSLLALQLAVSTAIGSPWIGRAVAPGCAMYLSAEDDGDELHRRLADITEAEGVGFGRLENLRLRSLAGEDALLAMQDRKTGCLVSTPLFNAFEAEVARVRPALVVLDTLADLTAGDENNRGDARQFVGLLRGIAIRYGCALLLLAHPSLEGMRSRTGSSGSTAWNGSVRSRLYLERVTDNGHEENPDARQLVTKKANYSRIGGEIGLSWQSGVFVADRPAGGLDRMAANAKAARVFLKLLGQFTREGREVRHTPGHGYAPAEFAKHPDREGVTKREFEGAMNVLLSQGTITIDEIGPASRRKKRLVAVGHA